MKTPHSSLIFAFCILLSLSGAINADPHRAKDSEKGKDSEKVKDSDRGDDDDNKRPGHPGKGHGPRKRLPELSSSAGVARGDFNGDGFADLATGVPLEDLTVVRNRPFPPGGFQLTVEADAGAVNVIYGSSGGLTATNTAVPASQVWTQETADVLGTSSSNEGFGSGLAAGDFNADGFSDLAISIPGERTTVAGIVVRGAVQVLYGSANGLSAVGNQLFHAGQIFPSAALGTVQVGSSLAWGDFNGDKSGDLAVEGQNLSLNSNVARVGILVGGFTGIKSFGPELLFNNASAAFTEPPATRLTLAAGRLNIDEIDDLVVGAVFADAPGVEDAGAVSLLFGSVAGPTFSGSQTFHQDSPGIADQAERGDFFGAALAVGDFNGDGRGDLAIGVPFEDLSTSNIELTFSVVDAGAAHVLFGTSNGLITSGSQFLVRKIPAPAQGDNFGFSLAAGSFNGDAVGDLAIGIPGSAINGRAAAGAVLVFDGTASTGLGGAVEWTEALAGGVSAAGDRFGSSLSAWNFGRNQIVEIPQSTRVATDLAIGIPGKDVAQPSSLGFIADAGAIRVLYGSAFLPRGLTAENSQFWTQNSDGVPDQSEASDGFGTVQY